MTVHESCFPRLAADGYRITSDPSEEQNLSVTRRIDRANGGTQRKMMFGRMVCRETILSVRLLLFFSTLGYALCDSGTHEAGYEKVAIYSDGDEYTHAARQLADGSWTSKLGPDDDIEHPRPESLAGGKYGSVVRMLKRPIREAGNARK